LIGTTVKLKPSARALPDSASKSATEPKPKPAVAAAEKLPASAVPKTSSSAKTPAKPADPPRLVKSEDKSSRKSDAHREEDFDDEAKREKSERRAAKKAKEKDREARKAAKRAKHLDRPHSHSQMELDDSDDHRLPTSPTSDAFDDDEQQRKDQLMELEERRKRAEESQTYSSGYRDTWQEVLRAAEAKRKAEEDRHGEYAEPSLPKLSSLSSSAAPPPVLPEPKNKKKVQWSDEISGRDFTEETVLRLPEAYPRIYSFAKEFLPSTWRRAPGGGNPDQHLEDEVSTQLSEIAEEVNLTEIVAKSFPNAASFDSVAQQRRMQQAMNTERQEMETKQLLAYLGSKVFGALGQQHLQVPEVVRAIANYNGPYWAVPLTFLCFADGNR
jgi:hypothetical protein